MRERLSPTIPKGQNNDEDITDNDDENTHQKSFSSCKNRIKVNILNSG